MFQLSLQVIQFHNAYLREQSAKRVCPKKQLQLDMNNPGLGPAIYLPFEVIFPGDFRN